MCKTCWILGYLCFTFPPIRYNCAVGMLRPIRRLCRADSRTQWKLSKYLTAVLTKAHKSYPLPARRQQHSIRKVPSYPLLDWFQSVLLTDPKFLFENNDIFPSVIYSLHWTKLQKSHPMESISFWQLFISYHDCYLGAAGGGRHLWLGKVGDWLGGGFEKMIEINRDQSAFKWPVVARWSLRLDENMSLFATSGWQGDLYCRVWRSKV